MNLQNTNVVVTGGSRGLGLGLVEALVERGANVTVVARNQADLASAADRLGVRGIAADVTDEEAAHRIVAEVRPDLLVLNAGTRPPMGPIDAVSWSAFSQSWQTDVRGTLFWLQAALRLPLAPGARVLLGSSGAALGNSPLSGGYAGAKRTIWMMARYADIVSRQKGLGIRFQALVPMQIIGGTGVGDAAADAYARNAGISTDAFLLRFGAPMPPRAYGDKVVSALEDEQYSGALALGFRGVKGITILETPEA